ncbi:MAG: type II toxin-antitoxin system HicA family toxin [Alphaproteobacteria bacterium]|nr:type II toxin-antitoxin system HicA family toxin [Alphaproteobacteria bacterium]
MKIWSSKDVVRRLVSDGWTKVAQDGSHAKFKHPGKAGHVIVALPRREIPRGTLKSIFHQAGWEWPPD